MVAWSFKEGFSELAAITAREGTQLSGAQAPPLRRQARWSDPLFSRTHTPAGSTPAPASGLVVNFNGSVFIPP